MVRQQGAQGDERRFPVRIVVAVVAIALLLWFVFANSQRVRVHFIVFNRDVRLIYALVIPAVLGFIAGWFVSRARRKE
jgi:uncharacterized integral membrane protein